MDTEIQWTRLLHFSPGDSRSQVTGPDFFLDPQGRRDPRAELRTTLKYFFDSRTQELSLCRFPARWLWAKQHFPGLEKSITFDPFQSCPHFKNFYQSIIGPSVTLVFSSYYVNNPSSTFGHTLLRVNKNPSARDGKRYELLDYGVNYAAVSTTDNAFIYGFFGLFGFFRGVFTTLPYYHKVREYNDFESRDLWEYDLNLSPDQVSILVAHTWEVGHSYMDYFYLTENCSYHMLSLLEVANPQLNLIQSSKFWIIPADTIKTVYSQPQLVRAIHYRPAQRNVFQNRLKLLSTDNHEKLLHLLREKESLPSFPLPESNSSKEWRDILDAAIDYFDMKTTENPEALRLKNRFLLARSQIPLLTPPVTLDPTDWEKPHLSHGSRRLSLGGGEHFLSFQYRFSLHDLLDPQVGYLPLSQVVMFDGKFRWWTSSTSSSSEGTLSLEHLYLVDLISMTPYSPFLDRWSWRLRLGIDRSHDTKQWRNLVLLSSLGFGKTWEIFNPHWHIFPGIGLSMEVGQREAVSERSPAAEGGTALRAGGSLGPFLLVHYSPHPFLTFISEVSYYKESYTPYFYQTWNSLKTSLQWSPTRDWGFRWTLVYQGESAYENASQELAFHYYY